MEFFSGSELFHGCFSVSVSFGFHSAKIFLPVLSYFRYDVCVLCQYITLFSLEEDSDDHK